jgi:hypothetical protein
MSKGSSKREISRELHCGRHTIDAYVAKMLQVSLPLSELSGKPDAELAKLFYSGTVLSLPDSRYEYLSTMLDYYQRELTRHGVNRKKFWRRT